MIHRIVLGAFMLFLSVMDASAQESSAFEMSSSHFGVTTSTFVNAGGAAGSNSFFVEQNFGSHQIGRMESASFTLGTFIKEGFHAEELTPQKYELLQNYPNPFNQNTVFRYNLPQDADVRITVLSVLGREIVTIYNGRQSAGAFELNYAGKDSGGMPLPSGIYFCRLNTKGFDKTIKFAILR